MKTLLAHGAEPNAQLTAGTQARYFSPDYAFNAETQIGATPYWLAAKYGETEMMRVLAASGADPRHSLKDNSTPLIAVLAGGTTGATNSTSDRRARYLTPTELAAIVPEEEERITLETARLTVQLGADVNAATEKGDTALHLAANRGDVSVVQFLIEHGGNVNARNRDGDTPLHNAAYRGEADVVPLLVKNGADLAATNDKGETPLARTALGVRSVSSVFVPDDQLKKTAEALRQLGATK